MAFRIDHVTIAWSWLQAIAGHFGQVKLPPEYGGIHSNGATHMSMLGFDDGSYIELVSVRQPGQQAPRWHDLIVRDGGACAWCVDADDIDSVTANLRAHGVTVDGPHHVHRIRPDGMVVEWDVALIGDHEAGRMHPFIIKDRTPRENRVAPSRSVAGSELTGIDTVVLAVPDVEEAAALFRAVYDMPAPEPIACAEFPGPLVAFPGEPLALAGPGDGSDWVSERIAAYGTVPCAYLIASTDMERSRARSPLAEESGFGDRALGWIDGDGMRILRLGVVEARR